MLFYKKRAYIQIIDKYANIVSIFIKFNTICSIQNKPTTARKSASDKEKSVK